MNVMITYARADQVWVARIADQMRADGRHLVWLDTAFMVGGTEWWMAVCREIEQTECMIAVPTPSALTSIYWEASLAYTRALNKPIVWLDNLGHVEHPESLNIDRILTRCEIAFTEIRLQKRDGSYQPPSPLPMRPPLPAPKDVAECREVFAVAEQNAAGGKIADAEALFGQVIRVDPNGLGITAQERLASLGYAQVQQRTYSAVVRLMANPTLRRGAESAWHVYVAKYGTTHDPNGYGRILPMPTKMSEATEAILVTEAAKHQANLILERTLDHAESDAQDVQGEIDGYSEVLYFNPQDAIAYFNRAVVYREQGELDRAIADSTEAIRLDPEDATGYQHRAAIYKEQERFDLAIADYTEAIRLDPENATYYNERGRIYQHEEFDLAIADYTESIRLDPTHYAAYHNRGLVYYRQEEYDLALADYTESIRLDPSYAPSYYERARDYRAIGELALAIADYTEAIRLNPDYVSAYNNRANIHSVQGEPALAVADYIEAIRLDPDDARGHFNRGLVYCILEEYDLAIADYTEAIRLNPDYVHAYYQRAEAYDAKGRFNLAIVDYGAVLRLNPDHQLAYFGRGLDYLSQGRLGQAARDLFKFIKLLIVNRKKP